MQFFYLWDCNPRSLIPKHILSQDRSQENETNVTSGAGNTITPKGSLLILQSKVFTLAHIYDMPRLRDLSIKKFQEVSQLQWVSIN